MTPYYSDDAVTIYHGDCREVMPTLSASAIITDPPYGVGFDYGDEFKDVRGDAFWAWFLPTLEIMRATTPVVVFTHRVTSLRVLTDWDWISIWNKPLAFAGLHALPVMPHWEPIFMYGVKMRKDIPRHFDVINVNPVKASKLGHPCPKPVGLMTELIKWVAPVGVILDPFMGSGTTLRAAKDLGRTAIGIDSSEAYCEMAAAHMGQEVLNFGGAA